MAAFSSVINLNVTSAAAYRALANQRVGGFRELVSAIQLGADDGGAGPLASQIFGDLTAVE